MSNKVRSVPGYGGIINRLMEGSRMPEPKIGMGATITHWSDRSAGTVVKVVYRKGSYAVVNARPIAGGRCRVLRRFDTHDEAAAYIGTLPGHLDGRYGLDGPADPWEAVMEVHVQGDHAKRIDSNGMSESQEYEYTPNPEGGAQVFKYRKGKACRTNNAGLLLGHRDAYHDYSF